MRACELQKLQKGRIVHLSLSKEDGERLFYLGIYQGAVLQFLHTAPLHDPYLFYVQGSLLILRKSDAMKIEVEPV